MFAIRKCLQQLIVLVALLVTLTGCVRYETNVKFFSFNAGEFTQHITIEPQFYQLNRSALDHWLQSIEQRTYRLQGQIFHHGAQDLTATIPFRTAADLASKFNQFFSSDQQLLSSHLSLTQNNFVLASRQKLSYELDLSSLAVTDQWSVQANSKPFIVQFGLQVPHLPTNRDQSWQLQLGKINHIDAVFWLPNPLGLGALAIMLLVAIGSFIKRKL